MKYLILSLLLISCCPNKQEHKPVPVVEIETKSEPHVPKLKVGDCITSSDLEFSIKKYEYDKVMKVGKNNYLFKGYNKAGTLEEWERRITRIDDYMGDGYGYRTIECPEFLKDVK